MRTDATEDGGGLVESWLAGSAGAAEVAGRLAAGEGEWPPGKVAGEWEITGFLGRGGSSEVYCARHVRLGTPAALKALHRTEAGPRERFDREVRFLMSGPGPSFPAFLGTGVEDGRPWVAMELLEECPLPGGDAGVAAYLADVASGVAALHARGWLHRDLKPANILRRADGHAVLADFGLLRALGEDAAEHAAAPGGASVVDGREAGVGTPGYAAPEQFAGGEITPAVDIYALGMLADECFGGKPPRAWERIVRRATASLPRQRYASPEAFLGAVRRRHWRRNAVFAALGAALLAAAAWAWRGAGAAGKPEIPEMPETPEAPEAPEAPETPEIPGIPEAPEAPETPEIPEAPEAPETPEIPEAPEVAQAPAAAVSRAGVREERAAALTRFEADEARKEAVLSLVEDLQPWGVFMIGRHEVTQAQWAALMEDNPSRFRGDGLPVDSLTAGACLEFLARLNETSVAKSEGLRFRLPTAKEWQGYAKSVPSGTPEERLAAGWFAENAGGRTHPAGEKGGGRGDVFGNVRELTSTWGEAGGKEGFRCLGGSWADPASGKSVPEALLEQPHFMWYWNLGAEADAVPSDYPAAVCPAPGETGFRVWAEERTPARDEPDGDGDSEDADERDDGGWEWL